MVGVEHGDERGVGLRQRVVDVARLRALVLGARDVADAVARGEIAHRRVVAVVEHVDPDLRAAQADRGGDRQVDDVRRLLVDRDEHVDRHAAAVGARFSRTRSCATVHQKPSAWLRLNSSAAIRIAVQVRRCRRGPGWSSQPKYQSAHGTPSRIRRRHAPAHAPAARHGIPRDPPQADVPGLAAHWNSQTSRLRCLEAVHELSEEAELPDHLVRLIEERLVVLERGQHEHGAPLPLRGDRLRRAAGGGCRARSTRARSACRTARTARARSGRHSP